MRKIGVRQFLGDIGTILVFLVFSPVVLCGWAVQVTGTLWRLGRYLGTRTFAERS